MQKLARAFVRAGSALLIVLAAAGAVRAAAIAIVVVPKGMILETQLMRTNASPPSSGAAVGFVVTHDLRVGHYVVIAAGARGIGHLARATHGLGTTSARRVAYDYVLASDGTRIPVAGSLPYLTTRASRNVVIYDAEDDGRREPEALPGPAQTFTDAPLARP